MTESPPATDAPDPDVRLLLDCYAAFARGDIETAVTALHPDVVWTEAGDTRHGPAAVTEYLHRERARWSELTTKVSARPWAGEIVVRHHLRGTLTDGTAHEMTVARAFVVAGGQILGVRGYADPADAPADPAGTPDSDPS